MNPFPVRCTNIVISRAHLPLETLLILDNACMTYFSDSIEEHPASQHCLSFFPTLGMHFILSL